MSKSMDRDQQALVLRDQSRSFVGIARILELDSPVAANAAFNRALRRQRKIEQTRLRIREVRRLDILASRVRERDDLGAEEVIRRLSSLKHQRKTLFVA